MNINISKLTFIMTALCLHPGIPRIRGMKRGPSRRVTEHSELLVPEALLSQSQNFRRQWSQNHGVCQSSCPSWLPETHQDWETALGKPKMSTQPCPTACSQECLLQVDACTLYKWTPTKLARLRRRAYNIMFCVIRKKFWVKFNLVTVDRIYTTNHHPNDPWDRKSVV